jgi:hypothetical protein
MRLPVFQIWWVVLPPYSSIKQLIIKAKKYGARIDTHNDTHN